MMHAAIVKASDEALSPLSAAEAVYHRKSYNFFFFGQNNKFALPFSTIWNDEQCTARDSCFPLARLNIMQIPYETDTKCSLLISVSGNIL